jgi:hypothetical protein
MQENGFVAAKLNPTYNEGHEQGPHACYQADFGADAGVP